MDLLAWHNILFFSALGVSVLIVIGAALGGLDADGDFDADADADDGPQELLGILDIGQIPFTVLLMVSGLIFGLSGVAVSLTLGSALGPSALGDEGPWLGVIAVAVASVMMVFLTARVARLIIKHLPASETHVASKADLVGTEASMFTTIFADVREAGGEVHRIECRSDSPLEPGMRVTVVDYDPETQTYNVSPLSE